MKCNCQLEVNKKFFENRIGSKLSLIVWKVQYYKLNLDLKRTFPKGILDL